MNRIKYLLAAACLAALVLGAAAIGKALHADKRGTAAMTHRLTVYTTLPADMAEKLAAAYMDSHKTAIDISIFSAEQLIERMAAEIAAKKPAATGGSPRQAGANMVIADSDTLEAIARLGGFVPYISEVSDQVATRFRGKNDGWVGLWYDPMVFAVNNDYFLTLKNLPLSWAELGAARPNERIALTDFLAADAAGELYLALVASYGSDWTLALFHRLHPRVVQYSKYLSTPARMAGMGETDIAIAPHSEAMRYISSGYPLRLIYPEDGTSYFLIGAAITGATADRLLERDFADWLLGDEAQIALRSNGFFFIPTNTASLAAKTMANKGLVLFPRHRGYGAAEKRQLLDRWVKEVRFQ